MRRSESHYSCLASHCGIESATLLPPTFPLNFWFDPSSHKYVPYRRPVPDMIMKGLFIGDEANAYDKALLREIGITHVLSVFEVPDLDLHTSQFDSNMTLETIHVSDEPNSDIGSHFPRAIEFISTALADKQTPNNVLVHCVWGMSRSCTVVVAYLMYAMCMDWLMALRCVQHCRPIAIPNVGFAEQLVSFGRHLDLARQILHNEDTGNNKASAVSSRTGNSCCRTSQNGEISARVTPQQSLSHPRQHTPQQLQHTKNTCLAFPAPGSAVHTVVPEQPLQQMPVESSSSTDALIHKAFLQIRQQRHMQIILQQFSAY
ncbi:phosphatases II [Pelomyxa schiedti]|nr:phosphatases II [Pelomyxa schiedti]